MVPISRPEALDGAADHQERRRPASWAETSDWLAVGMGLVMAQAPASTGSRSPHPLA